MNLWIQLAFSETHCPKTALPLADQPVTKLTDYFRLNERDCDSNTVFYPDLPKYYTWNKGKKTWHKHKRGFIETITALSTTLQDWIPTIALSKHQEELYYLLMLLHAHHRNHEWLASRAIITPTNDATEIVNSHMMNKFPGNDIIYRSSTVLMRSPYISLNSLTTSIWMVFHPTCSGSRLVLASCSSGTWILSTGTVMGRALQLDSFIITHLDNHIIEEEVAT